MNMLNKFRGALLMCASVGVVAAADVSAQGVSLRNTVTGELLDLSLAKSGPDTPAVQTFLATGENRYRWDKEAIASGGEHFLTACSGCHGHEADGKVGPALRDDYWTYPKNGKTDQGLFETIFGGAQAMMGPQYKQLTLDEMLRVVAWIRAVYVGPADNADWMSAEEKRSWKGPWVTFTHTVDADGGPAP